MDKSEKPYEIIATRFQISKESAKYFLGHVQKSFKTEKPPQQVIIDFMKKRKFKTLPTPYEVASLMAKGGIWDHPMHAEPPVLADEPDLYK